MPDVVWFESVEAFGKATDSIPPGSRLTAVKVTLGDKTLVGGVTGTLSDESAIDRVVFEAIKETGYLPKEPIQVEVYWFERSGSYRFEVEVEIETKAKLISQPIQVKNA